MSTIPASTIVSVNPSVLSAGGNALALVGMILSTNGRIPVGAILSFPTAASVATYFGQGTTEAGIASIYFAGFDNSNIKPAKMLMSYYASTATGAFLRGGNLAAMTLTALQALSGTLIISVNGIQKTSSTITLSGAASFSAAAALIVAAFTTPGFTVIFDTVSSAFLFTNTTTGSTSTLTFCTGTLATSLMLTAATGAVLSAGAAITTPAATMNAIVNQNQNWATFMTATDPDGGSGNANKQLFAAWATTQNMRYMYVAWDTDLTPTTSNAATTSLGYILSQLNSAGTCCVWGIDYTKAAFVCGSIASIDFTQTNGTITLAFKSQSGLVTDVTDPTTASNLQANGYNYYGSYSTAAQGFNFFYPGSITGSFLFADAYVNQIWFNNALQLALMTLLTSVKSLPYDINGYTLVRAACQDPINQALNYGMFAPGVAMSALQIAEVNAAAGLNITQTLQSNGYYLQVLPAIAQVRGARTSPPITVWYLYAGSIQRINVASVEVQ